MRATEIFDGTTWVDGPPIPTPRDHLAVASDGRYLYAVGGRFLAPDRNVGVLERLDVTTGNWQKLPDMPTPRGGLGAAIVNGKLVAAGGEEPTGVFDTVEAFDLGTGAWSPQPPLKAGRHGLAVAAVGPSLFAIATISSHSRRLSTKS